MRLGWSDGTIVAVWFTAKGAGKSSVAVAHRRLEDQAEAERLRRYWGERLDALGETLTRAPQARRARAGVVTSRLSG